MALYHRQIQICMIFWIQKIHLYIKIQVTSETILNIFGGQSVFIESTVLQEYQGSLLVTNMKCTETSEEKTRV